jgi:hypothetical protein
VTATGGKGGAARSNLGVLVDGVALPEAEARALWERFSDWMEEHRGDLAGFAAREGFASIHPGVDNGRPVLIASKTAAQRPYAPATAVARPGASGGGSGGRHEAPRRDRPGRRKPKK